MRKTLYLLLLALTVSAAASDQAEIDLIATKRLFPEMGPGLVTLKRDAAARRYLVLSSRSAGVAVYNTDGQRIGTIPPSDASSGAKPAAGALQFPSDFDITSDGRIVIADRAANALRFYDAGGALVQSISTPAPSSVAALPEGEVAVASSAFASPRDQALRLITVYDKAGRIARTFGDLAELASRRDLNRFLNIGRVSSDASGALYYAFTFLPEPTARKYDRFGYASLELSINSLDIQPAAQAVRREIKRQDERGGAAPRMKTIINALGVDPATQEFWLALGNVVLHLDREGTQLAAYRAYSAEGVRLEPVAILVEPDRLLFACDPLGVFALPRRDKQKP
ncbi:MAG: hypothetical protein HY012_08990 [Acidobacteria bacterium]|nr:hypothetical protein [Acidobacteriota bacterium]